MHYILIRPRKGHFNVRKKFVIKNWVSIYIKAVFACLIIVQSTFILATVGPIYGYHYYQHDYHKPIIVMSLATLVYPLLPII